MRHSIQREIKPRHIRIAEEERIIRRYLEKKDTTMIEPFIKSQIISIKRVARKYLILSGNSTGYYDFIVAGVLGAIQALKGFDPRKNKTFFTYAEPIIKKAVIKEIHRFNHTRVARNTLNIFKNIKITRCTNCPRRCLY